MDAKELGAQPAYPVRYKDGKLEVTAGGMNKREAFARAAMHLWRVEDDDLQKILEGLQPDHALAAKFCVGFADAMLAELAKGS